MVNESVLLCVRALITTIYCFRSAYAPFDRWHSVCKRHRWFVQHQRHLVCGEKMGTISANCCLNLWFQFVFICWIEIITNQWYLRKTSRYSGRFNAFRYFLRCANTESISDCLSFDLAMSNARSHRCIRTHNSTASDILLLCNKIVSASLLRPIITDISAICS